MSSIANDVSAEKLVADDLAFVRQIAEEGRMRPLQGGPYLIMWGCISSIGLAFTVSVLTGYISVSPIFIGIAWMVLSIGGTAGSIYFGRREAACVGGVTLANNIEKYVWIIGGSFMGLFVLMIYILVFTAGDRLQAVGVPASAFFTLISPVCFGVYAIALGTTAVAGRAKWLWPFVGVAFGAMILTMLLVMTWWQFGAAIGGIIATTIIPGIMMVRKNKQS